VHLAGSYYTNIYIVCPGRMKTSGWETSAPRTAEMRSTVISSKGELGNDIYLLRTSFYDQFRVRVDLEFEFISFS
jgi:hypothetical protein